MPGLHLIPPTVTMRAICLRIVRREVVDEVESWGWVGLTKELSAIC